MRLKNLAAAFAASILISSSEAQMSKNCNPLKSTCRPDRGLAQSTYEIDFTKQKNGTQPPNWRLADYARVTYNTLGRTNGMEMEFLKKKDAPYIETEFYILFGRVDIVVQAAPGPGIVSSMVLWADDLDEIDWEFRGSMDTIVQTNYFGKGVGPPWNRSTEVQLDKPMAKFHTYTLDWTEQRLQWIVDGKLIRELKASECTGNSIQYPQAPSKLSLSLWDAGDPDNYNAWGGGKTPIPPPAGGYSFYIKSLKITNYNPATVYTYTDKVGNFKSIKIGHDPYPEGSASLKPSGSETFSNVPSMSTVPSVKPVITLPSVNSPSANKPTTSVAGQGNSQAGAGSTMTTVTGVIDGKTITTTVPCSNGHSLPISLTKTTINGKEVTTTVVCSSCAHSSSVTGSNTPKGSSSMASTSPKTSSAPIISHAGTTSSQPSSHASLSSLTSGSSKPATSTAPSSTVTTITTDGRTITTTVPCTSSPSSAHAASSSAFSSAGKPASTTSPVPSKATTENRVDVSSAPGSSSKPISAAASSKLETSATPSSVPMTTSTTVIDGKTVTTTMLCSSCKASSTAAATSHAPSSVSNSPSVLASSKSSTSPVASSTALPLTTSTTVIDGKIVTVTVPCSVCKNAPAVSSSPTSHTSMTTSTTVVSGKTLITTVPCSRPLLSSPAAKDQSKALPSSHPPSLTSQATIVEYSTKILSSKLETHTKDGKTSIGTSYITTVTPTAVKTAPIVTVVEHSTKTVSSSCITFSTDGKVTSSTNYFTSLVPASTHIGTVITSTEYTTTTIQCTKCGSEVKEGKTVPVTQTASVVPLSTHIGLQSMSTQFSIHTISTVQNTITSGSDKKVITKTSLVTSLSPVSTYTTFAPLPSSLLAAAAAAASAPSQAPQVKTITEVVTKTVGHAPVTTTHSSDGKVITTSTPIIAVVPATVTQWTTITKTESCPPFTSAGSTYTSTTVVSVSPVGYNPSNFHTTTVTPLGASTSIVQLVQTAGPSAAAADASKNSGSPSAAAQGIEIPPAGRNPSASTAPIISPLATSTIIETTVTNAQTVQLTRTTTIYSTSYPDSAPAPTPGAADADQPAPGGDAGTAGMVTNDAGALVPSGVGELAPEAGQPSGAPSGSGGLAQGNGTVVPWQNATGSPIAFPGEGMRAVEKTSVWFGTLMAGIAILIGGMV